MISFLFSIPQWLRISLSVIYLGIIAFLSLLPPNDFPDIPLFRGADKLIHTCLYFGLTILACWSMHSEVKTGWYYVIIFFSIGFGVSMEAFQYMMHMGRSFDPYDILGNSVGTIIGALIYVMLAQQKRIIDFKKAEKQ